MAATRTFSLLSHQTKKQRLMPASFLHAWAFKLTGLQRAPTSCQPVPLVFVAHVGFNAPAVFWSARCILHLVGKHYIWVLRLWFCKSDSKLLLKKKQKKTKHSLFLVFFQVPACPQVRWRDITALKRVKCNSLDGVTAQRSVSEPQLHSVVLSFSVFFFLTRFLLTEVCVVLQWCFVIVWQNISFHLKPRTDCKA